MSGGDEPNGDECDGWDAGSQNINHSEVKPAFNT